MINLPDHWAETTIGNICRLTNGRAFRPSDWSDSGLPIIRIQNLNSREGSFNYYDGPVDPRFEVNKGDLLFAWSGTPGTSFGAHIWNGPTAVLNQHIFKVEFDRKAIDAVFLRDAINETLDEQSEKSHGGVGLRHVTKQAFSDTRIPFPPLREQIRIAELLSHLRQKVEALSHTLNEVAGQITSARLAVLELAFSGELTKGWRSQQDNLESTASLLVRVPEPEQPKGGRTATTTIISGRSAISVNVPPTLPPSGWEWVSLNRLARQETGHTPSRRNPEYWDGPISWLGIKDASLHHGTRITSTIQTITAEGVKNSAARLLPAGTVCLSRTASVGYITILGAEMATSQDFATWTCGEALIPDYLMYALMSEGPDIRRFGEGSVHTTIYFPEIRAFHIKLAPVKEQLEVVRIVRLAFQRIDQLHKSIQNSSTRVDALLKGVVALVFSGRLTSREDSDGTAAEELARVQIPEAPTSVEDNEVPQSAKEKGRMKSAEEVLSDATDWLTAQELFKRCGVGNGAETETLEQIFAELRTLDLRGTLLTEPIMDKSGNKVQNRLRLVK